MRIWPYLLPFLLVLSGCLPQGSLRTSYQSESLTVDRFVSDINPLRTAKKLLPIEGQPGELIWLTGAEVEVFKDGSAELFPQLMSKTTVDVRWPDWHNKKFQIRQDKQLFQLDRGTSSFALPRGFGIPISSNEPLNWTAQSSNFDAYLPRTVIRQNLILGMTRQRGLQEDMKPIQVRSFPIKYGGGQSWDVPPGGLTVTTRLSDKLNLKKKQRIHGLVACFGSGAKELWLTNLSTKQVLMVLNCQRDSNGQVTKTEAYSDPVGIPIDPNQQYEISIAFENSAQRKMKTSSSLSIYLSNSNFRRPTR